MTSLSTRASGDIPSLGRTNVLAVWSLATTATTANQEIGTRTVTAGKKYVVLAVVIEVYRTAVSATAALLGLISIRIGDTAWITLQASNNIASSLFGAVIPIPEGQEIPTGTDFDAVCTPADVTSTTWKVNVVGFEK